MRKEFLNNRILEKRDEWLEICEDITRLTKLRIELEEACESQLRIHDELKRTIVVDIEKTLSQIKDMEKRSKDISNVVEKQSKK